MTEVGIETLQEHLTDYLRRAREGERIVITENGHSIALLIPMEESETVRRAWKFVESGAARWGGGKPKGSHPRPRNRGKSASDMVLEDRGSLRGSLEDYSKRNVSEEEWAQAREQAWATGVREDLEQEPK